MGPYTLRLRIHIRYRSPPPAAPPSPASDQEMEEQQSGERSPVPAEQPPQPPSPRQQRRGQGLHPASQQTTHRPPQRGDQAAHQQHPAAEGQREPRTRWRQAQQQPWEEGQPAAQQPGEMPWPSSRQPPPPQQQDNKRDRAPQPTEEPEEHNPNKRGRQEPIPPPEPEPPPTPLVGRSQHGPMWQKNGMGEQVEYSVEKGRLDKYGWLYDSSLFLGLLNPGLFCGCTVCILQLWVGQQLLPLPQQQNTEHKWVLQQKEESEESNPNKRGQLEQIPQPELEPPPSRGRLWYGAQRLKKERWLSTQMKIRDWINVAGSMIYLSSLMCLILSFSAGALLFTSLRR